jgi:hypothetical protein
VSRTNSVVSRASLLSGMFTPEIDVLSTVLLVLFATPLDHQPSGGLVHFRNRCESPVLFFSKPDGSSRDVLFEVFD